MNIKIKIIYLRHLVLTIFLLVCYQNNIISQETGITHKNRSGFFFGFGMGACHSQIKNEGIMSVSVLQSGSKSSPFGSAEIGYFFSDYFGLSSGLGFISYNAQLTLSTYQNNFSAIDSEKEAYECRVSGTDISEEQKTGFVNIPVCINIRIPFNKTIGIFLQPGVNLSVALNREYTSSGIFTFKGYYPADNVLLENLPAYGFPSNVSINTEGELKLKTLGFNAVASAGFDIFLQKKFQIAIAACFDKSLSPVSNNTSPDDFSLLSDVNHINSFMGGSTKTTTRCLGLKLIFRYYLNSM